MKSLKKTSNGLDKIMLYAEPRGIYVKMRTLGLYKVVKGNKTSVHEAVRATDKDGIRGWIINMANRQRKFYPATEVQVFPFTGSEKEFKDSRAPKAPLYPAKHVALVSADD